MGFQEDLDRLGGFTPQAPQPSPMTDDWQRDLDAIRGPTLPAPLTAICAIVSIFLGGF
jgi:hypothetical protein